MSVQKTSITADNSDLVATDVRNAADVKLATNSNADNISEGYSSISNNDTHVKYLEEALIGNLVKANAGADESLVILPEENPVVDRVDDDTLSVGAYGGNAQVFLDLGTAANWIGGVSLESADEMVHVYEELGNPGSYKLSDKYPQYTAPAASNNRAVLRVNQVGWNGTSALGLNATTVNYDTGVDGDLVIVGNYAVIYSDSAFTLGRGKGSGASSGVGDLSVAKIVATTGGAVSGTLTLDSNHNIAINDNDYIFVVDAGRFDFRLEAVWYRHIGGWYNDGSSNLLDLMPVYGSKRRIHSDGYNADELANYTTSSTTFVDVDGTNLVLNIFSNHQTRVGFVGSTGNSLASQIVYFDIERDGVRLGGDEGLVMEWDNIAGSIFNFSFAFPDVQILPGTHQYKLQWRVLGGTATIWNGSGTVNTDIHPRFWLEEYRD